MPGEMTVHLFRVSRDQGTPSLETLLRQIERDELEARLKVVGHQEVRLESILPPHVDENDTPYWLLDFAKIRFDHGPGRASRVAAIEGFDLDENEGFGEETAVLFDARHRTMLIQYNHYGVRSSAIQHYFNIYEDDVLRGYGLGVALDEDAGVKFARKQILKKIHFKIAPPKMSAAQRRAGVGLGQALELNDNLNGANIEIIISAGRQQNAMLNHQRVHNVVAALRRLVGHDDEREEAVVQKLEILGKENELAAAESVNLLVSKLETKIPGLNLGDDRRYTQRSRWDALLRARLGWRGIIEN